MKKGIACVLLSAMVAFGSFAAGCGGNSQQAEKKTFTIAYAPNESTTDSTDARSHNGQHRRKKHSCQRPWQSN